MVNALILEELVNCFIEGDWKRVLEAQSALNDSYYLWPKPKTSDLEFISKTLKELEVDNILSIGCGTGLLEWLLTSATGINVTGVEIDKLYWTSKYARKCFINLIFPKDDHFSNYMNSKNNSIMFCYFNNSSAFLNYVQDFHGKCLIIIGPHNSGRHTEPTPFDTGIPINWKIWASKEIEGTGDCIAIYIKQTK